MTLCQRTELYLPLLGRLFLAQLFLLSGAGKLLAYNATASYMAAKMPWAAGALVDAALVSTIIIEIGGSLMLAFGIYGRWAALALILWIIPVTAVFHAFWAVPPEEVRMQMIQFQKNLAILGGLMYVAAFGSGAFSLRGGLR